MKLKPGQHIHLVGIGGAGLSAIARILLGQGYIVSGSDRSLNPLTDTLSRDGAVIYQGHDTTYINGADTLIITSAVKPDHLEVAAAREKGIPVYKRQDIIADLMEGKFVIAVAGTKGKTTTTSMIVHILRECGRDPSYIVGGVMGNTGTNAAVGSGTAFVIEADEYENMFLGLKPNVAVITNVEYDHPDFFKTPTEMIESFRQFISRLQKPTGTLIVCEDDPIALDLGYQFGATGHLVRTYGVEQGRFEKTPHIHGSMRATNIRYDTDGTTFDVGVQTRLPLLGLHNVQNALAAISAVTTASISDLPEAVHPLSTFIPAARRFELRADINQIAIIDDYAHNPMSIRAVLEAARQRYPGRQIWAVWQPHTFSRTQALMSDYIKSFDAADHVLITDIYPAREIPVPGVTSAEVVKRMAHPDARHTPTFANTVQVLIAEVKSPAAIIIMSAGDAPQIGIDYLRYLQGDV